MDKSITESSTGAGTGEAAVVSLCFSEVKLDLRALEALKILHRPISGLGLGAVTETQSPRLEAGPWL